MIRYLLTSLGFIFTSLVFWSCGQDPASSEKNEYVSSTLKDLNHSLEDKKEWAAKSKENSEESPLSKDTVSPVQPETDPGNQPSIGTQQIQEILSRANPEYRGQGKLHEENGVVVAAEFPNCGLRDISPLRSLQLQGLDLSGNPVRELRHLKGMPLRTLFLENTRVVSLRELNEASLVELRLNNSPVESLDGLEGQPLENLYAVNTRITEVSALSASNLRQLWLSESPVSDVSGLAGLPLVSLTLHRTLVEDLSFVRKLPVLQRLHIGETLISDLSPLEGMNLTRLVFSPEQIRKGMKIARGLYGITEIGTSFDDRGRNLTTPEEFWAQFPK